jgi:uncharacterized protein YciI
MLEGVATHNTGCEGDSMHFLLIYDIADDYLARRADFRSSHLTLARAAVERGELLLGGAAGDPVDGAFLLFAADSAEVPQRFAQSDPYVLNGLVRKWTVKPWNTVVGPGAANPAA